MSLKKTASKDAPHAVFVDHRTGWTWNVLKTYQTPDNEAKNQYARWFCFVTSPYCPDGEYGDTYISDVHGTLTEATDEWKEAYGK